MAGLVRPALHTWAGQLAMNRRHAVAGFEMNRGHATFCSRACCAHARKIPATLFRHFLADECARASLAQGGSAQEAESLC